MRKGFCKMCGKFGVISRRSGLCPKCQVEKMKENLRQIRERKGVFYEKWKERISRSFQEMYGYVPDGVFKRKEGGVSEDEKDKEGRRQRGRDL